jgi:hypothetical protein
VVTVKTFKRAMFRSIPYGGLRFTGLEVACKGELPGQKEVAFAGEGGGRDRPVKLRSWAHRLPLSGSGTLHVLGTKIITEKVHENSVDKIIT